MWQSVLRCWTDHWTVSEVELDLTRDPGFVLGSGSVFVSGFGGGRQRLSSAETWDEAPSDSNQLELCSNFLSSSGARFWQICMGTRVSCVPKFWSSIVCGTYVQCSMASVSSGRCWSTAAVSKAMSWPICVDSAAGTAVCLRSGRRVRCELMCWWNGRWNIHHHGSSNIGSSSSDAEASVNMPTIY